jgi:MFS family permease
VQHFQRVLRQPDFFRLWAGQIISSIGDRFYQFALLSLVLGLNAGAQVGKEGARVIFVGMVPGLLFAPLFGWMVDRFNRKATLIFADLSRVVLVLALIYIWFEAHNLALVYAVIFCMGGMNALFIPARQAALPQIVGRDELITANSLMALVGIIASFVGGASAGLLASIFGACSSFIITAVGFLVSAFFIFRIKASLRPDHRVHRSPFEKWKEVVGGFNYVREDKPLLWVVVLNTLFSFVSGFFVIAVLEFTMRQLDLSALHALVDGMTRFFSHFAHKSPVINAPLIGFGILMGSLGAGVGLGIASCGPSKKWTRSVALPFIAFLLIGVAVIGFGFCRSYLTALAFCMAIGWSSAIFSIPVEARLQSEVANSFRGRVFAFRNFCTTVAFLAALAFRLDERVLHDVMPSRLIEILGVGMIASGLLMGWINRRTLGSFWGRAGESAAADAAQTKA